MKKSELRKLIKEVLQERWSDFLVPQSKRPHIYTLYTDVEEWIKDMLDVAGRYKGPKLPYSSFSYGQGKFVADPTQPYATTNILYIVMDWNEAYAEKHKLSREELTKSKDELFSNYSEKRTEDVLGYFPTEQ